MKLIKEKLNALWTRAKTKLEVKHLNQNEYKTGYKPLIKGWHNLSVKVAGEYVGTFTSPFKVVVKAPVRTLGKPILTIDHHLKDPRYVAVNKNGEIFVTVDGCQVSVFSPDGSSLRSFGTGNGSNYIGIVIDKKLSVLNVSMTKALYNLLL